MLHDDQDSGLVYFLAFVSPPAVSVPEGGVPREVILLVDHSGSMKGVKWEASDEAVKKFLSELTERDAFTLGLFHNTTRWVSDIPRQANPDAVKEAIRFVEGHKDSGGTNLGVALEQGLGLERSRGEYARHLLVITDAQVTDAGRILRLAEQESKQADRRRISVLCIDVAPNLFLVLELAERGGGVAKFLTSAPEEKDIFVALDKVFEDWSEPVLAGLRLSVNRPNVQAAGRGTLEARFKSGTNEAEWSQIDLGNLPAGRTIWVAGRVPKGEVEDLVFRLTTEKNPDVATCNLNLAELADERPALKALFGAQRVLSLEYLVNSGYDREFLNDQLVHLGYPPVDVLGEVGHPGKPPKVYQENAREEAKKAIRGLLVKEALDCGLACSETAFVAVRKEAGKPVEGTVPVANALPSGWSNEFLSFSYKPGVIYRTEGGSVLVSALKLQVPEAIKVLLMSRLELIQHLSRKLQENPLLEEDLDIDETEESDANPDLNLPETDLNREDEETEIDCEDFLDDSISKSEQDASKYHDDKPIENVAESDSLQDHLLSQLRESSVSEEERRICEEIIGNIDDNGYLKITAEEIASELNVDVSDVERMLDFIQTNFEPAGVGARDIREYLLIQMRANGMEDTLAAKIITAHLVDFAANRISKIAESLSVAVEEVQEAAKNIKKLMPYPGRKSGIPTPDGMKIPDVIIEKVDDEYKVILNDDGMPRLRLSQRYLDMLKNDDKMSSDTRKWLEGYKQKAIDLLKSIEERRQNIVKVTEKIFEVQKDFLEKGPGGLKPLAFKDIADTAGIHESTVSRITTNKYVQTPQGIYKLKEFFGIGSELSGKISTFVVKEMLKEIIEAEDPANPLSDQQLSDMLKGKGYRVARRTVAKYREEFGILPFPKRRKSSGGE